MNKCRLCHSKKVKRVVRLAPMPIGDAYLRKAQLRRQPVYALDMFLCRACGLAQLPQLVAPDDIYRPYIYRSADSSGLVRHFEQYVGNVCAKFKPPRGALAIDIGSNDGSFVRFFRNHGLKILGIDPATVIAREATKAGVPTIPEFFTQATAKRIRQEHGQAAIVTANNIFANVANLDDFVAGVKELLLPKGLFIFETGYVLDLLQKAIFDNIYHEHLSYFSIKPLVKFFRRHGLQLVEAERVNTKGGSIRCFVQHTQKAPRQAESVQRLIALEEDYGVQTEETFRLFSAQINLIMESLTTLIRRLRSKGLTVAGYGASVGVSTIIYYCGLGKGALDYLVDDNPQRQGLYSPGYHLPVLPPKAIYAKKPDYVLLLAWQYARPIMARHRKYLEAGGRFILLLPQVRIVEQNDAL
ncbi:MAG: methyltransferase domain-containing protein [Lentisphaerae bacterium]|nr:methyltransferase domain-containing protein [Lentisphaerota bacterium]